MMKNITRTIWILSMISLFTDMASEMLYPVMPIYLKTIGFSVVLIGVLEGIAEAIAGFSKGYFGNLSDSMGKRVPFVQAGYSLSAISKPIMAFFVAPLWVFFARTLDRLGKGIRTGARDALLSDESTSETKGRIFGFHRSMDTLGAVLGPGLALLYLYYYPGNYKTLFLIAFLPGLLAIITSFLLKDKKTKSVKQKVPVNFFSFLKYWKESPEEYRKLVFGLLVFTVINSSDVFLLLKAKQAGFNDTIVIAMYIFYNLVFALSSFPIGILGDKIGLKKTLIMGLGCFALVYFGMSLSFGILGYFGMFLIYGVYAAATDGISKAWISNLVDRNHTATAIGTFTGFQSVCTMLASSIAGLVWYNLGPSATFLISAVITVFIILYFIFRIPYAPKVKSTSN